ncbi:MAG: helix-turn-helix domain-containing protein [Lachnospiraceae bacterium]|nr:helix-turn-helix domain-containing protein [Lachnospiraceae bacterium]
MAEQKTAIPTNKRFLTATDVAELLDVSRSTAYRIIKRLNDELNKAGKLTVAGKISAKYFYENTYL